MDIQNSKPNFTGLIDNSPSDYHRKYGKKMNCTDIDCFEYDYVNGITEPIAIIENKHYNAQIIFFKSSILFQNELANKLKIPFFIVVNYSDSMVDARKDFPTNFIKPVNSFAKDVFSKLDYPHTGVYMSIRGYCIFLGYLRNYIPDDDVLCNLPNGITKFKIPEFKDQKW